MTHTSIPNGVLNAIERLGRQFLWQKDANSRGLHYIGWKDLCQPMNLKGLGFYCLNRWKGALCTRVVWDLLQKVDSLLYKVLMAKYGMNLWSRNGNQIDVLQDAWILDRNIAKWPTFVDIGKVESMKIGHLLDSSLRRKLAESSRCLWGCNEDETLDHCTSQCSKLKLVFEILWKWGFVMPIVPSWGINGGTLEDNGDQERLLQELSNLDAGMEVLGGSEVEKFLEKITEGNAQVQSSRGKHVDTDCNDFTMAAERMSGVCKNVSIGDISLQQPVLKPGSSRPVKKESDEIRDAANVWKKSMPVMLSLYDDVRSFLREDGMVKLDLNKARGNIQKLDRALAGCLARRRLPFWVVQNELHRKWGHLGLMQITPMGSDCFLCWFVEKEARDNVMIGGPWYIAGQIIRVEQWVGHKAEVCKETYVQSRQQDKKDNEMQNLLGSTEAGVKMDSGLVHSGIVKPNAEASSSHDSYSAVNTDQGEWTIVTRRRRPINARAGVRSQKYAPTMFTKSIWREVNKSQKEVKISDVANSTSGSSQPLVQQEVDEVLGNLQSKEKLVTRRGNEDEVRCSSAQESTEAFGASAKRVITSCDSYQAHLFSCSFDFEISLSFASKIISFASLISAAKSASVPALIDEKILCMHGGLSPDLKNLDQIHNDIEGWGENDRGVSYTFGPDKVGEFLPKHDLDLICRAHKNVIERAQSLEVNIPIPFSSAHGFEVAVEFKPVEHPIEPFNHDQPV
ncbi:hypothetical protein KFK09_001750 [Dendrobium nobile]|uniref:Serine/threonine specific protein phosphatases domain-containing protein n=1 Tax=Dendrobium nobile TaxID=94219 RepID=A0A8T3C603_DENNO|nr:hypothetical protein KFK09_001750 [Dendrobium nobile]